MATWCIYELWIRAVARWAILGKTLKVQLLQTCIVIEDFGSNRTGIAIGNAWRLLVLKVRRDLILDGLLIQNVANIQSVNAFIGEFDIQKLAVPCFCRFIDPDSFENEFQILENEFQILENEFQILENDFQILENKFQILENEFQVFENRWYFLILENELQILEIHFLIF